MKGVTFCTESVNGSKIAEHNLLFQEPLDKPSGPTFVIVSSGIQPDFLFTVATSCFSPELIGLSLQPAWEENLPRLNPLPFYCCPSGQILILF